MVLSEVDIAKADPAAASHPLLLNGDDNVAQKNPRLVAENNLCSQYEEKVRPCIDLIDSLRALGVEQDLALPAIAVIGDQSSGKSSVLEALSGVALPRGSAQNTIAGEGMGISHELITLEISSQDVPDLTLIDLPGITRVAVGNQPADIGYKIKTLIKKYIQRQETISLVVVPSNVDIATTEALSMAQEVDPEGDRTIGILTKPDLVDKGTEDKIVDVVRNLVFHLKKGYMIVKCRGQQEIQDQLSLSEALQREKIFFEDHPYFRDLLEEGKATVPCLAEKLTSELIAHICKSLPLLESQIKESHQTITEELQKYGVDIPEDENEKMFFLIDKINAFNQDITALIQGEETVGEEDIRLFTRLRHEFHKWSTIIENNFQEGHKILSRKIQKFENQYRGRELPGFVNFRTFETIMKQQIKALEEPAVDMLHTVTDMVRLAFTDVSIKNFEEFFNLHRTAKFKIEDIRAEQEREGEKLIRLHFQMEQIVYCQDQVYRGALQKVREKEMEEEKKKKPWDLGVFQSSSTTDASMEELFQHLMAYHQEASKRISSHIPLIIQFFMLQTYGQQLQKAMLQLLQDKDTYSWLLKERSDTSDKRKFLKERLARLTQARRRLAQFPG
ncbi:interferon-induced GTP-binding protein Mx1 isoform X2 [Hylobates moloch]|uniref:interferon-induced GTP-binding protein Mx1 isoform X2 n=1 Tax=Hylobates moloch TaxID=81572 RepID=UPI0013624339|nr:interferon-induced GTP-binding protein Mx1 isoform X2 [Hylobates moloch]